MKHRLKIKIVLNEYIKSKYNQLHLCIAQEKKTLKHLNGLVLFELLNQDFKELFDAKKSILKDHFNLVFLDQSGIKQITEKIFLDIVHFPRTDFMFFISSSVFKRFAEDDNFKKYHPRIDIDMIRKTKQTEMHRLILQYYKSLLSPQSKIKLYPFTIKKGKNIYGIIFGTKHPLGIEKFLRIAWETNDLNGEANFDIDDDRSINQLRLGFIPQKLSKTQRFEKDLENFMLSQKKVSNKKIYDFTLENGHIPKHAKIALKNLKKNDKIYYEGNPNISYSKCYKEKDIKIFTIL